MRHTLQILYLIQLFGQFLLEQAYIYLDEAHSIGALGSRGRGVLDYFQMNPADVDILMGTFTKSFGSSGGYIAGSHQLITSLRRKSYAHAYGTSISPPLAQQILTSMRTIMGEEGNGEGVKRINRLHTNSVYFRHKLSQLGFRLYGHPDSPVVPVVASMPTQVSYILSALVSRGVAAAGAIYPAAPITESRVRFCLSAAHTKEMLDKVTGNSNVTRWGEMHL